MIRCRCLGILFLFVLLSLAWRAWGQAPPGPAEQRGELEASQTTVTPGFNREPPERYLSDAPPALSPEEVERRQDALRRTHLPGPPLPVEPHLRPEALQPTSPPTPLPWPAELSPPSEPAPALSPPSEPAQDIIFFQNQDLGGGAPSSTTGLINEPSVANSGTVVFMTGNWYAASSTDGGQTFTYVNPYTGPFPPPIPTSPSFCCDQVVIYAPSVNAIFWLQNYDRTSAHGNVHRINVDQGANGTWDCFYDFSPQALPGASPGDWFDWQDLVLGSNSLYHTANVFNQVGDLTRTVIQRLPLSQMAACVPRSMINVFNVFSSASSALSFFRATHGAGTTIYWGAHVSTSTLRIFGLAEGCSSVSCISINDRSVDPWIESNRVSQPSTCPGPDNLDWCGRSTGNILGAYVANGVIGFLWNATQGGGFPYPHVRFARFRESDRSLLSQGQIWNPRFAFLYPSVAVNSRGHLGGTILTGGGDFFPSCNAWIADDINGGGLEPLDLHNVVSGTSGPVENVSGDYLTARPHAVFPNTWIGTCFSLQGGGRNTNARPRFVWFGRQRDTP